VTYVKTSTHRDFDPWIVLNFMTKFPTLVVYKEVTKGVKIGKGDNLTTI
jgi:hypothetical protein